MKLINLTLFLSFLFFFSCSKDDSVEQELILDSDGTARVVGYLPQYKFDFNNNIESLIVASDSFDKNKWNSSRLEIPIEIRWRTSTASTYKFWRVYLGLKTSFLLNSKYKFESENSSYSLNSLPFRKIQSGLMLNAGNNTWNLGLYMGLNPIFNDEFGKNNMEIKDLKEFTLGLTFYIL